MTELTTNHWKRYGKDRLYVSAPDGSRVGWVDLLTEARVIERTDLADDFTAVVDAWHQARAPLPPMPRVWSLQPDQPEVPAAPVQDLADNVAGQQARTRAQQELTAQRERGRVRSFLAVALDAKTDERAWRVGAGGEERVGARLDRLTKRGWHVLHSVPVGRRGSDIDHVVIGRGGVYTVNTKTHPGGSVWVGEHRILVNGHRTDYLRNSRHEAARAGRLLSAALGFEVPVRATLVFLTGTFVPQVTIKQQPDVLVLDRLGVPGAFRRAPRRLSPEQVEQVFTVARRSTTWA